MVQSRRGIIAFLLALVMLLGIAGCGATTEDQAKGDAKASVSPADNESQKITDYMKAAKSDLKLIDDIMADQELGLLDDSESDEELTAELIVKYDGLLTGYNERISATLTGISSRAIPEQSELLKLQTSEKAAFETLASILREYSQTLTYAGTLLEVTDELANLENVDESDLQAIYDAYSANLGDAIKKLEQTEVPSYIESFNKDFIDTLKQADDTVYYALSAVAMDDPLRTDAAEYLMEIFSRRADIIIQESAADLDSRQKQLVEDAQAVKKTSDGLKSWLDTNIANLGGW